jgi:hypothetical protein
MKKLIVLTFVAIETSFVVGFSGSICEGEHIFSATGGILRRYNY